jgi:hypothetical protein
MATVVNALKGTLSIGTTTPIELEAQLTEVGVPATITRDAAVTVLTGDVVQSAATTSHELAGTMLLDLSVKGGIYEQLNALVGTTQTFSFFPVGPTGGSFTGSCVIDPFDTPVMKSGGNIASGFKWPVQGAATYTPPP